MNEPNFESFRVSLEWQLLTNQLLATQKDYLKEIVEKLSEGNSHSAAILAGKAQMIDEIIAMPEYMTALHRKGGNGNALNEERGQDSSGYEKRIRS